MDFKENKFDGYAKYFDLLRIKWVNGATY